MQEKNIFRLFKISLLIKGAQALFELVAGGLLLFANVNSVSLFIENLVRAEIVEDPGDSIFRYIFESAQNFSISDKTFLSWYLLSHGIVKGVLIGGILRNKTWAYPLFLAVQIFFIVYQTYGAFHRHSALLAVFTAMDILIFWLVWHEYKLKKKHGAL